MAGLASPESALPSHPQPSQTQSPGGSDVASCPLFRSSRMSPLSSSLLFSSGGSARFALRALNSHLSPVAATSLDFVTSAVVAVVVFTRRGSRDLPPLFKPTSTVTLFSLRSLHPTPPCKYVIESVYHWLIYGFTKRFLSPL